MTDQEINAAIEREVGNQPCGLHGTYDCACGLLVRNYTADLNAMHDAEHAVFDGHAKLWHSYLDNHLNQICEAAENPTECATARQRAEAFLRTIGKWKE